MGGIENLLAEAAEKIKKEAYAAGWRDAIAAVSRAITEAAPSETAGEDSFEGRQSTGAPIVQADINATSLPKMGTTPFYVYQAVKKHPGMSGADVVTAVRAEGHAAAEPQIRTALARLGRRRLVVNRHKKWFPG